MHIRPRVYKLFNAQLTHLSMKFQLLIKTKMLETKTFLAFNPLEFVCIMLINVKMSTIVGILTFTSMINFMLS